MAIAPFCTQGMIPGTWHDGLWYHTFMDEKDRKLLRMLGVLSTVGLTLVFATVIGLFVGLKLDQWLGTSPWLTIVFLMFGLIAGFRNVVQYAIRSQKSLDEDDDKKS